MMFQPATKDDYYIFKICECSEKFYSKSSYYRHKKQCNIKPKDTTSNSIYKVCECSKEFYSRHFYYVHKKECTQGVRKPGNFVCREQNCYFRTKLSDELIHHLQNIHEIDCKEEDEKIFNNLSEFETWKEEYEKDTKSFFKRRCTRKSSFGEKSYFYCNRSGISKLVTERKRQIKSQGLTKIGFSCPARLVVCESATDPKTIKVKIRKSHYGHDCKLAYVPIPKKDRFTIAHELAQGISPSQVLKNVLSRKEMEIERKHIITRKDIWNIAKSYGIKKMQKPSEDHLSFDAYIQNLKSDNSLLIYKRQGEEVCDYPEDFLWSLEKSDFALAIMTNFQKQMIKKFGNNIVYLDSTYGTNMYDFNLITLLVVDEFREGIPVAWLISNKGDTSAMKLFFLSIKNEVGNVMPKYFMSEKAPEYFNSWKYVFENETQKLLCHWHVHQDWRRNLNKINDKDLAASVYKRLCMLLEESSEDKFNVLLEKTCQQLLENSFTETFHLYFENEWVFNKHEWAKCFRKNCSINTNMFLESLFIKLKYGDGYLNEEQIDKCINVLQQYADDLAMKRLVKLEKGKNIWMSSEINKRHEAALSLPLTLVSEVSPITWNVKSEKSVSACTSEADNIIYNRQEEPICTKDCQVICQECKICLHAYLCNCPDALTGTNICKHIHLVHKYRTANNSATATTTSQEENDSTFQNQIEDFGVTSEQNENDKIENFKSLKAEEEINNHDLKIKLMKDTLKLCSELEACNDRSLLLVARQHINSAIASFSKKGSI